MNDRLKVVTQEPELAAYLPAWQSWAATPLQSPEWILSWWSAFRSPAAQLAILIVHDDAGLPIGLAPLYIRESWSLGRSIRFLGSGKACSDFQTLLAAQGEETKVANAVADWLISARARLHWSFVELEGISQPCQPLNQLMSRLTPYGCSLHSTELESTWRLDLSGGWTGFLAGLSKTQRSQTRNLLNRFDKSDCLTFSHVHAASDLQAAFDIFIDLHQRRWNASGQPGCFADSRFRCFLEGATSALATKSQVQMTLLEDRGEPIASQLFLLDRDGNAYMYQSGRDPLREAGNFGRMLNALAIRSACEKQMQFMDFLRGDEVYKSRLGAQPAKCLRVRAVAPATLPRLRHGLWTLAREFKHGALSNRQNKSCAHEAAETPPASDALAVAVDLPQSPSRSQTKD